MRFINFNRGLVFLLSLFISQIANSQEDSLIRQDQKFQNFDSYKEVGYNQILRPQFHFSSLKNWINDPNGMVWQDGVYHLYFQHNPLGVIWGNMTWGHAVSIDMIHWKQLPHAILPYGNSTIFSGSAVVDEHNLLGRQVGTTKTLVAIYTSWGIGQAASYSVDNGRSFQLIKNGYSIVPPTGLNKGERDPYVFWHEASKKWVMILWIKRAEKGGSADEQLGKARIYTSDNLIDWLMASDFDRDWIYECMNLIELTVDGNPKNKKWVVFDASFHYEIGEFDGKTLTTDKKTLQGDFGNNFYAGQTFNNSPDGRRVLIGWMNGSNEVHRKQEMPFSGQFSFPSKLELRSGMEGIRLYRWPIKEVKDLYVRSYKFKDFNIAKAHEKLTGIKAELMDVSLDIEPKDSFKLSVRGLDILYNLKDGYFEFANSKIPAPLINKGVKIRLLLDRTSLELFINEGASVASFVAIPDKNNMGISLYGNHEAKINSITIHELKTSWDETK